MTTRTANKAATRLRVLDAAHEVFEASGWEGATIRDIAKAAGMSTGAVFASFADKATLHREVYGEHSAAWRVAEAAAVASGVSWADMPQSKRVSLGHHAHLMLVNAKGLLNG